MDINSLTIGQVKELLAIFGAHIPETSIPLPDARTNLGAVSVGDASMIGKYVIVRCQDAGVHAGILDKYHGRTCILREGRRLWYHEPADKSLSWYEGVAISGLSLNSKTSATVARCILTENCEIVLCSKEAEQSIRKAPTHAQTL